MKFKQSFRLVIFLAPLFTLLACSSVGTSAADKAKAKEVSEGRAKTDFDDYVETFAHHLEFMDKLNYRDELREALRLRCKGIEGTIENCRFILTDIDAGKQNKEYIKRAYNEGKAIVVLYANNPEQMAEWLKDLGLGDAPTMQQLDRAYQTGASGNHIVTMFNKSKAIVIDMVADDPTITANCVIGLLKTNFLDEYEF